MALRVQRTRRRIAAAIAAVGAIWLAWAIPPAHATEALTQSYRGVAGGLNDATDPTALKLDESPEIRDVVIDDPQATFRPRNGFSQCGVTPSGTPATALYEYFRADGTRRLIVSDNATTWSTPDCSSFTAITSGMSATAKPNFTTARNLLWIVNGSTHPFTWDGTSAKVIDGRVLTPNPPPPRCFYPEFWKERVWCGRTTSDPSGVQFTALTDSAGNDVDPSTHVAAWPARNTFYVDRDGGSAIYGLRVYRDRLYVFKNNGIWQIVFNNDFDNAVVKTYSSVGTRFNESIVEVDGLLRFVGPDGIYAFDGDKSVRISDAILNKFQAMKQPLVNDKFKLWTEATDFDDGTINSTSFGDIVGSVSLSSTVFKDDFNDGNYTGGDAAWVDAATNFSVTSNELLNSAGSGTIYTTQRISTGAFQFDAAVYPTGGNESDTLFLSTSTSVGGGAAYGLRLTRTPSAIDVTLHRWPGPVILSSKSAHSPTNGADNLNTYKIVRTTGGLLSVYEGGSFLFSAWDTNYTTSAYLVGRCNGGNCKWDNFYFWAYFDSGTFTTEQFDATTVSSWTTFQADHQTNSGTVGYEIRVGSNTSSINAAAYTAIVPGGVIVASNTQTIVQVRATLTRNSVDKSITPQADNWSVNYTQGGVSSQLIHAGAWKNRYWLTATTGTAATANDVVLVQSKTGVSWAMFDMKIGAMSRYNDSFYAAASTHSGIYRMDYGTNDNGAPIRWLWTSRDEMWDRPFNPKRLMEITVDFRRDSAANAYVGYSENQGSTWSDRLVDMSGSGYGSKRLFFGGNPKKVYRFRVYSNTRDEAAQVIGVHPTARVQPYRE